LLVLIVIRLNVGLSTKVTDGYRIGISSIMNVVEIFVVVLVIVRVVLGVSSIQLNWLLAVVAD